MRRDLGIHWNDIERDRLFHAAYEGLEVLEHRRRIRNVRVRAPIEQAGLRVNTSNESRQMIGGLGAEFLPDESGQLLLLVSVTDDAFPGIGDEVYHGLPRELAGATLDGALVVPEIEQLGAGVLLFDRAEVHPTLSSPVLFQWLAGAVVRLLIAEEDCDEVDLAQLLRVPHPELEELDTSAGTELDEQDKESVRHRDVEAALDWMRQEEAQAAVDVVNLVDELRQMEDQSYQPERVEERPEALDQSLNSLTRDDVEAAVAWVAREEAQAADDVAQLVQEISAMEPETTDAQDDPTASERIETWDEAAQQEPAPADPQEDMLTGVYRIETVDEVLARLGLANQVEPEPAEEEPDPIDYSAGDVTLVEFHKLSVHDLTAALAQDAGEEAPPPEPAELSLAVEPDDLPVAADMESTPSPELAETEDVAAPLPVDSDPWGEVELDLQAEPTDDESQIEDLLALFAAADAKEETGEDSDQPSVDRPAPVSVRPPEPEKPANREPIQSESGVLIAPSDDLAVFNTGVFDDLMQIVSAFRQDELADLPTVEDVMADPARFMAQGSPQAKPVAGDDEAAGPKMPDASSDPIQGTGQLRRSEVQAQIANGGSAGLDAEPLSIDDQHVLRHKLGQPESFDQEVETETDPAPPTLDMPRPPIDSPDEPNDLDVSTPALSEQEPRLVFGDDVTEPPITPKMLEDLQRLQAKVQKEETAIFVSGEREEIPEDYSDPFGYPPPMKAKRTPFGDLVFYQCAACGEYGAMKVAIHTYRCYRCEAVIEYRPQRVE